MLVQFVRKGSLFVLTGAGVRTESEALLILGSSLTVFSGFRFFRQAEKDGKPVAIINIGPVRGINTENHRVSCGERDGGTSGGTNVIKLNSPLGFTLENLLSELG